jgi:hypothetical protein
LRLAENENLTPPPPPRPTIKPSVHQHAVSDSASIYHQPPRRTEESLKETRKQAAKRRLLPVKQGAIALSKSKCFLAYIKHPLLVTKINTGIHASIKGLFKRIKVGE